MGLDLYLRAPPCKTCGHQAEDFNACCTYNMSPMWYDMFPDDNHMVEIEGMTGKESLQILHSAREKMIGQKEHLQQFNPPNGFGSYGSFLHFIEKLIKAAEDNPKHIWEAWR